MKNSERIIYGLLLTAVAFLAANLSGRLIKLNINFLPDSFVSDTAMLLFAILLICVFKKHVNYRIAWPKFKNTLKPILFGILAAVIVNSFIYGIGMSLGIEQESHYIFAETSPLQFFLFVFICASVAEELLFRGFLQNILKPLQNKGIKLFKRHISLPGDYFRPCIFIGSFVPDSFRCRRLFPFQNTDFHLCSWSHRRILSRKI